MPLAVWSLGHVLALTLMTEGAAPAETRIGGFVQSLADVSEAQRRFDVTFWVWLLSPAQDGGIDPARTIEITNAATSDRQYAVTTSTPAGLYSQVKFRASVRAKLDVRHFPFDRHTLEIHLEDAERDARSVVFVPDAPPNGRAPLAVSQDLDPQDWTIGALSLTTERHSEPTNYGDPTQPLDSEYSRAVLHIEIARKHSLRILLTLLLGTFMSAIVAFFAVLLPIQQSPPRYTLLSSALFVCIANRLLVDARLPAGSSLGLVDQMQLVTITGLLLLTGASLALTNLAEKRWTPARATQWSQRVGFAWIAAVLVIELALVLAHRAAA
ncbi:hypothetical protein [Nannocystis pusilla]|uniref:hypothetical protein n=1 Tax=Nannocystis pusilla TaxID=889268 RepID=UPI003BF3C496